MVMVDFTQWVWSGAVWRNLLYLPFMCTGFMQKTKQSPPGNPSKKSISKITRHTNNQNAFECKSLHFRRNRPREHTALHRYSERTDILKRFYFPLLAQAKYCIHTATR